MSRRTFCFDVKVGDELRQRFELPFEFDDEAIQHSKDLAARFLQRLVHNEPGLLILVLVQSGREIHRELVYPTRKQQP
jgi:hypothetical protein